MTNIVVITYNVFSPELSKQKTYVSRNEQEYINSEIRYYKIERDLIAMIFGRTYVNGSYKYLEHMCQPIICLQEVCLEWATSLNRFFDRLEYNFLFTNYGNAMTGHMGVAIACPKKYTIMQNRIVVANFCKNCDPLTGMYKPKKVEAKRSFSSVCKTNPSEMEKRAIERERFEKAVLESWTCALKLPNRYIAMKLKIQEKNFWVVTYHMPCSFRNPALHHICNLLFLTSVKRLVENSPLIIAADMNFTPSSEQYQFVNGTVNLDPRLFHYGPEGVDGPIPKLKHAELKKFTIFSKSLANVHFKEVLDYIFHTDDFVEDGTEEIEYPETIIPNEDFPSDHLMVRANLKFRNK